MYKAVIFDMDGTILNTIGDLTAASNYALEKMGKRHDFPEEKIKLCFGCGIDADMEKVLALEGGMPGGGAGIYRQFHPLFPLSLYRGRCEKAEEFFRAPLCRSLPGKNGAL